MKTPQTREDWYAQKFRWLKRAAIAAFVGILMGLLLGSANVQWLATLGMIGLFIGLGWLIIVLALIPILHWKDRYRGEKSTLWALFLFIETSSWSKIFYWFRHVLPDRKGSGRYADDSKDNG